MLSSAGDAKHGVGLNLRELDDESSHKPIAFIDFGILLDVNRRCGSMAGSAELRL